MKCWIAILTLVVIVVTSPVAREKRDVGDCGFGGKNYSNGVLFTTAESGPCIHYRCNNSIAAPEILECKLDNGTCVPFGTEKSNVVCEVSTCGQNSQGQIGFFTHPDSQMQCRDDSGNCVPFGTEKKQMCRSLKCGKNSKGSVGFFPVPGSKIECQDKGKKCGYKDGDKVPVLFGATTYNCTCKLDQKKLKIRYTACTSA